MKRLFSLAKRSIWTYGHGLALRVAALAAKLVFLLVVVPGLDEGIYSGYLYVFTVALIIARVLSLGAEEHLPTLVRGDKALSSRFYPLFLASFLLSVAMVAAHYLLGHSTSTFLVIALVAQLASGWVLGRQFNVDRGLGPSDALLLVVQEIEVRHYGVSNLNLGPGRATHTASMCRRLPLLQGLELSMSLARSLEARPQ